MEYSVDTYEEEFFKMVDAFGGIENFEKAIAEEFGYESSFELPW